VPRAVHDLLERRREMKRALDGGGAPHHPVATNVAKHSAGRAYTAEEMKASLAEAARMLSIAPLSVAERIGALLDELQSLEDRLTARDAAGPLSADSLLEHATDHGGVTVVLAEVPGVEPNLMRQLIDQIRQKKPLSAVLLATRQGDDKVTLVAGVSKQLQDRGVSAGKWIGPVAKAVGGGGGGRPDLAQAGGKEPAKLTEALGVAGRTIAEMLGA
jgi:alanyl-tRNA synthetase